MQACSFSYFQLKSVNVKVFLFALILFLCVCVNVNTLFCICNLVISPTAVAFCCWHINKNAQCIFKKWKLIWRTETGSHFVPDTLSFLLTCWTLITQLLLFAIWGQYRAWIWCGLNLSRWIPLLLFEEETYYFLEQ